MLRKAFEFCQNENENYEKFSGGIEHSSPHRWQLVNFCENDKFAIRSYCAIHNVEESLNLGDITKVDETQIDDFDMMTWGFPCTDISNAGKMQGFVDDDNNKTRSGLYYDGIRILREKRPAISIIENVKNLTTKKFQKEFSIILSDLDEAGYNSYWKVLNAKDFGVPQNRERVFIVSIRKDLDNGKFEFPEGFDNGIRLKDILEDEVDEKYYINTEKAQKIISSSNVLSKITNEVENSSRVVQVGNMVNNSTWENPQYGRVYSVDGISPTLDTMQGGGREPKIIRVGNLNTSQNGMVVDVNGISPTHVGSHGDTPKVVVIDPQGRKNKECVPKEICPTLRAEAHGNLPEVIQTENGTDIYPINTTKWGV